MVQQQDPNVFSVRFTPQSVKDMQELAKQMHTNVGGVIAQAVALLKMAQGRTVVLREESQSLEISNYVSLPTKVFSKS